MAILGREDLRRQLKEKEFTPVYLLFGTESYLRDLAAKTITDLALGNSSLREFNEIEHSLNESKIQYALSDAEQLPMAFPRRLVKITNVVVSANGKKDNLKEEDEEILARYLARPAETSVVIFVADELDKRRKISKLLLENSVAVEFVKLEDQELIVWAKTKLKDQNTEADEKAIRLLVGLVGNNLRRLTNEIEKLIVAAMPDSLITYDLVEALIPNSREISNFDLTDYLISKNKKPALQILKKILDDGAEPLMLLGLIASNFHRLFLAKELMRQGVERREVARILKLPYGKQEEFLATARRTATEKLAWVMQRIAKTDVAIKTSVGGGGGYGSRLQIEILVCELVNS
ncbi:MAG: DNA polymerase III subunit delta [Acidobacteria bacterium]|nr:DNA polymerase III subunit delta [Acidobacteriota bacterium]MCA1637226.1 DNA polymerase III subunit delta [Acidobacteriota bacterium]